MRGKLGAIGADGHLNSVEKALRNLSILDERLAETGRSFTPLSPEEQQTIVEMFRPYAARLAFYRGKP